MTMTTAIREDVAIAVLGHIHEFPEQHLQNEWHCASGMCIAGWATQIVGFPFASTFSDEMYVYIPDGVEIPADYRGICFRLSDDVRPYYNALEDTYTDARFFERDDDGRYMQIPFAARMALGVTAETGDYDSLLVSNPNGPEYPRVPIFDSCVNTFEKALNAFAEILNVKPVHLAVKVGQFIAINELRMRNYAENSRVAARGREVTTQPA